MQAIRRTIVLKLTRACNLACAYCYDRRRPPIKSDASRIDPIAVVRQLAQNLPPAQILFVLHGGEPLLIGHEAFASMANAMRAANTQHGHRFRLAIQTNATLITDDFVRRFDECRDLLEERGIGVSLDGPKSINDSARVTHSGLGSSTQITAGLNRLRTARIDFGLLAVVGRHNVASPNGVYDYLLSLSPGFLRFIPCHDVDEAWYLTHYGITPTEYARFLIAVFREWLQDKDRLIPVDPLVTIISNLQGHRAAWCEYERESKCQGFVLIDHNGGVACCDNWGAKGDSMTGRSLFTLSAAELLQFLTTPATNSRIQQYAAMLMEKCRECSVRDTCCGGCLATRHAFASHAQLSEDYCNAKRLLIGHIANAITHLRELPCARQTS